jgi:hypothetical protein
MEKKEGFTLRRILVLPFVLLLAFSISSCGVTKTPDDTVNNFLSAAQAFDFETMSTYMNPANIDELEEFTSDNELEQYFFDYLKDSASKMTYTIKSSETNADTTSVTVDFKFIDSTPFLTAVIGDVFNKAFSRAFSGSELTDEEMNALFTESLESQRSQMENVFTESTVVIDCVKIDGVWMIDTLTDDFGNVITANFIKASEEISNSF